MRRAKQNGSVHTAFAEKVTQRLTVIAAVCTLAVLFIYLVHASGLLKPEKIKPFIEGAGPWGPVALIGFVIFGTLTFAIPAIPSAILAGALYGPYLGLLYAYIGLLLSASLAFALGRSFRKPVVKLLGKHAALLSTFQERSVMIVVAITRALPIFSFEVVSYGAALTSISFVRYLIATAIGMLLPLLVFTATGSVLAESTSPAAMAATAVLMILLFFIVPIAIDHYNPFGWKDKLLHRKPKKGR